MIPIDHQGEGDTRHLTPFPRLQLKRWLGKSQAKANYFDQISTERFRSRLLAILSFRGPKFHCLTREYLTEN